MQALRLFLLAFGVIHAVMGLATMIRPDILLTLLNTDTQLSISAMNETRASYGGMYLALGLFVLYTGITNTWARAALMIVLVSCAGNIIGRLVSFGIDGMPSATIFVFLVVEIIAVCYSIIMLRKTQWLIGQEDEDE